MLQNRGWPNCPSCFNNSYWLPEITAQPIHLDSLALLSLKTCRVYPAWQPSHTYATTSAPMSDGPIIQMRSILQDEVTSRGIRQSVTERATYRDPMLLKWPQRSHISRTCIAVLWHAKVGKASRYLKTFPVFWIQPGRLLSRTRAFPQDRRPRRCTRSWPLGYCRCGAR